MRSQASRKLPTHRISGSSSPQSRTRSSTTRSQIQASYKRSATRLSPQLVPKRFSSKPPRLLPGQAVENKCTYPSPLPPPKHPESRRENERCTHCTCPPPPTPFPIPGKITRIATASFSCFLAPRGVPGFFLPDLDTHEDRGSWKGLFGSCCARSFSFFFPFSRVLFGCVVDTIAGNKSRGLAIPVWRQRDVEVRSWILV